MVYGLFSATTKCYLYQLGNEDGLLILFSLKKLHREVSKGTSGTGVPNETGSRGYRENGNWRFSAFNSPNRRNGAR